MARLFTAGAEEQYLTALWDSTSYYADIFNYSTLFTTFVKPRSGNGCYRILAHGTNNFLRKTFSAGLSEVYFGGATYFTGYNASYYPLYLFTNSACTQYIRLKFASTGAVEVYRISTLVASSATGVVTPGQWFYLEVKFIPRTSAGTIEVKINGNSVATFTGDTTDGDSLCWGFGLYSQVDIEYWDDIAFNDSSGSTNNTWTDQIRLIPLRPASQGTSTGMSKGGLPLGSNWQQARNDSHDLSFIQADTASEKDSYYIETADLPTGAVITNLIGQTRARIESGSGTMKVVLVSNGTEVKSSEKTLGAAWKFYQYALALNPNNSSTWTEADLANVQIGMERTT